MKAIRKEISPKNFEIIKDDDDVQVGDKLVLGEWKEGL